MVKFIWPMHSPDKGGCHLKRGCSTPFGVTLALNYFLISCHVTEYPNCDAIWNSPSVTIKQFYVGPRIPDMYPLHITRHERCNTTTSYCNSNKCFWQGRNKILKHIWSFIQMTKTTNIYIYMKTNMELRNTLLHNIIKLHNTIYMSYALPLIRSEMEISNRGQMPNPEMLLKLFGWEYNLYITNYNICL